MSLWMNTGTIAVTLNNKKVTGTGTAFVNSAIPARPGQPIVISNVIYEIESVESDTVLWLATNYLGASAADVKYSVMTTMEGSFNDLARRAAQVMGYWQEYLDDLEELFTGTGTITITTPAGEVVQLPTWGTMQPKDPTLTTLSGKPTSTFGLARLADASAAAQRSALELKKASLVDVLGPLVDPGSTGLTGAIIESGINSNGRYIKFADGSLICSHRVVHNASVPAGGEYSAPDWTLPVLPTMLLSLEASALFYTNPGAMGDPLYTLGWQGMDSFAGGVVVPPRRFFNQGRPSTTSGIGGYTIGGTAANSIDVSLLFIGKWY